MIHSARIFLPTAASTMSGIGQARGKWECDRRVDIPQRASSSRSWAFSNLRYPGKLEAKPASRVPIALHCPVMENGEAPARPIFPVISARLLIAFTVSAPCVLWLTPIVQPMKAALRIAVEIRRLENQVFA